MYGMAKKRYLFTSLSGKTDKLMSKAAKLVSSQRRARYNVQHVV